jgi:hypothetical protein
LVPISPLPVYRKPDSFGASIDELTVFEKANWWEANFKSPPPNAKLREVCAKDGDEMYQRFSKHWPKPAEDTGFPDFIMNTGRYRPLDGVKDQVFISYSRKGVNTRNGNGILSPQ